jgi:predicted PurR-regulated permease PerM
LLYCSAILIILVISVNIIKNYFISFFIIIILLLVCSQLNNFLIKNNIFNKKISAVFSVISINLLIFILIFSIGKIIVYNINLIFNHDINNMQYFLLKTSTVLGK